MKTFVTFFVLVFTFFCLQACSSQEEYEKKITEEEVPEAVLQAFNSVYPNAEVRGYTEEQEEGKKIYEISFTHAGKTMDVTYTGDGELFEVEESIDAADLPQAVRDEVNKKFTNAEIKLAEKVTKNGRLAFEVNVDVQENGALKRYELVFDAEGALLQEEIEADEE